jgi:hypothetical protein
MCRTATPCGLLFALLASTSAATEFRIATSIYHGDEEKPVSEMVTLFSRGVVYDFLEAPRQFAVFRAGSQGEPGRFILLDPSRRVRTELTTDRIEGALEKLRDWAAKQPNPALRFAAEPKFDETFKPETGELVLASHQQTYRLKTARADEPDALAEYREFVDWYARLNTLMHGGLPPDPRLAVNAALAKYEVVPTSVELTRAGERDTLRAEHDFTWRLSRHDIDRIEEVNTALSSYEAVDNEKFLADISR